MRKTSLSVAFVLALIAMLGACSSGGTTGSITGGADVPFVCTLQGDINGCVAKDLPACPDPPFGASLGPLYYNPEGGYFTKGTAPVEITMYFGPGDQDVEITIDIYDTTNFKAGGIVAVGGGPAPDATLTVRDVINDISYVAMLVPGVLPIASTTQAKAGQWKNGDTISGSFNVITDGLLSLPPSDYYHVRAEFTDLPYCVEPPA